MEFSAQQIADFLQGEIQGNPNEKVCDISRIEDGRQGTLSFLANPKYTAHIYDTKSSIVLVNKSFVPEKNIKATLIRVENAYESLAKLLQLVESVKPKKKGISSLAFIAESAKIGKDVYIAPFVFIGENVEIAENTMLYPHVYIADNVKIGSNCTLQAGVRVGEQTRIGNRCVLQAGAAIGFDGFGFAPLPDGSYDKLPQMGNVVIEDDVEIQANATVDRATMGSTIIRKGVKLDNLVQIAHNVEVGENTVIAAQSGVAGSTKIGKHCIVAGQVGFAGHITIADNNIFGAKTGVTNSIKTSEKTYLGYPVMPANIFRRSSVVYKNLAELQRSVYELQRQVADLQNKKDNNTQ